MEDKKEARGIKKAVKNVKTIKGTNIQLLGSQKVCRKNNVAASCWHNPDGSCKTNPCTTLPRADQLKIKIPFREKSLSSNGRWQEREKKIYTPVKLENNC